MALKTVLREISWDNTFFKMVVFLREEAKYLVYNVLGLIHIFVQINTLLSYYPYFTTLNYTSKIRMLKKKNYN